MKLSRTEAEQRVEILERLEAGRRRDQEAVHVRGFPEAIAFVDRLAPEAEAADHHPDILINYKRVTLTYSTHSEGGLTEKDFAGRTPTARVAGSVRDESCRMLEWRMPDRRDTYYGSREVAALTGLSARQLQIWDAGGLISPAIPSHRTAAGGHTERRYTPIELFELLVLADLRRRGFSVPQLHAILDTLKDRFGTRLFEATGGGGPVQLLTDGQRSTREPRTASSTTC